MGYSCLNLENQKLQKSFLFQDATEEESRILWLFGLVYFESGLSIVPQLRQKKTAAQDKATVRGIYYRS